MKTNVMNTTKARIMSIILTLMLVLNFGAISSVNTYAATTTEQVIFVIHTTDIPNTRGVFTDSTTTSKLSYGSSQSKAQKWFDNKVANSKDFHANGLHYVYTGTWAYEDGSIVSFPLKMNPKDYEPGATVDIYLHPVYDITSDKLFSVKYVDNVSTGSGSWSNGGAVSSFSHTFKDPSIATPVDHYRFVEWVKDDGTATYGDGEAFSLDLNGIAALEQDEVIGFTALWQPSVTVNHYNVYGELISSNESFDEGIAAYSVAAEDTGYAFKGWMNGGEIVSEDTVYSVPEMTTVKVEQKVIDLYPAYTTTKSVSVIFDDEDDKDGIRPESLEVSLIAGEEVLNGAVVSTENGFTYTFEGLNAYSGSEAILYNVINAAEVDGYDITIENGELEDIITLKHEPQHVIPFFPPKDDPKDEEPADEPQNEQPADKPEAPAKEDAPADKPEAPAKDDTDDEDKTPVIPATTDNNDSNNNDNGNGAVVTEEVITIVEQDAPKTTADTETTEVTAIEEVQAPLASPEAPMTGSWALINLILMAISTILSLVCGALWFTKRNKDDEESEEEKAELKKHGMRRTLAIAVAAISIIAFVLTENMDLPMVLVDKWTILMAGLLAADVLLVASSKKSSDENDEDMEAEPMMA